ncbi:type II toxin-antitoxin system RelE/ParE family toxin [Budviciaceae bacterium BWR-B9]|uniref:Type II toxin-antitoxin system RelE/ParE family toxin n=1 Tax=Limnobaculum allomyrinae TaxID=2791986 RepID=A0ABS1IUY6_9GAMM|nr:MULTISPECIES: type II toxin-antitoxin system RelE/ParE family toxin [Limnobaculum]MBK5145578.1 type II toxin-antitoxin system RelE/ParE family toxin [Limnobaculum allomyrinae]MBV7693696.1 type II toxin-antitoxin system RelE/ParE family toxin [Limnobaculum sp. M2-1]
MKGIELTPKAEEDLVIIWEYSYLHFGIDKADEYIDRISVAFDILSAHQVGTLRPELGEDIFALPIEQHVVFFISTATTFCTYRFNFTSVTAAIELYECCMSDIKSPILMR